LNPTSRGYTGVLDEEALANVNLKSGIPSTTAGKILSSLVPVNLIINDYLTLVGQHRQIDRV
jgi:hypothetical protein